MGGNPRNFGPRFGPGSIEGGFKFASSTAEDIARWREIKANNAKRAADPEYARRIVLRSASARKCRVTLPKVSILETEGE